MQSQELGKVKEQQQNEAYFSYATKGRGFVNDSKGRDKVQISDR